MKKRIIGLLYSGELDKDLYLKYQNACNKLPDQIVLLPITKENLKKRSFALPQGIYNLCYNNTDKIIKEVEKIVGKNRVFNRITKFDKWEIYNLLLPTKEILLPKTLEFTSANLKYFSEIEDKIILKPKIGSKGEGVILLEKKEDGYYLIDKAFNNPVKFSHIDEIIHYISILTKGYLIQKFVENKRLGTNFFDIRIYVQKNIWGRWQITGGISRIAVNKSFITNIVKKVVDYTIPLQELYSERVVFEIIENLTYTSLQVANILEGKFGLLGELAVDYSLGLNDKIYIIEVNGKPMKTLAKRLQSPELYNNLYLRPMEYAYYLTKTKL
ncbi:YheC/YheD family protein [Anaerobranca gottschalkii]|uniref:YheC/D like ATP-grasp n=1 Tax=Anaerobranca gottschalkii DSM 13577 TaxID=1120990 RepID=A0A1H9ZN06_9FIRM|nr:YheC/YheD family protein [Anaerobranca gottschalkii]SES83037.1 YheC/D like ATP-grasp [Anaerobranca gottschalkii DSM 13577]